MNWLYRRRLRRKYPQVRFYNPNLTEVQANVTIGEGSRVGSFTLIQSDVQIGKNCTIGSHCNICSGVRIGDHVSIQTGCHITRGVTIGHNSFVGPKVVTMNDKYMDGHIQPPRIGNHTRIGGGSCIFPDITIGDHVLVGAGSIVTKNLPDRAKVWGNPARPW